MIYLIVLYLVVTSDDFFNQNLYKYLLIKCSDVRLESDGIVDEELIEVEFCHESVQIGHEEVVEVHGVNHGIETFAECVIVVLEAGNDT